MCVSESVNNMRMKLVGKQYEFVVGLGVHIVIGWQLLMIVEDSRLRHHEMLREWNEPLSHGTMGFSPALLTFENSLKGTAKAGIEYSPSFFCEGDKFYMLLQRQLVSLFLHSWTYYMLMKRM